MKQNHPAIRCDVHHISENQRSWSERPRSVDMEQVKELLDLIQSVELRGELVVASFIVCRVQPCKERAYPAFDYRGNDDRTRERLERLSRKEVIGCAPELFTSSASFSWPKETKAFNCTNPPPQVIILPIIVQMSICRAGN